jgi:uncharacterized protein
VVKLYGREEELQRLEKQWVSLKSGPQLVLLSGRRRVGKTSLVAEFARNRRSVFFTATREATAVQLKRFAEVASAIESPIPTPSTFANWHEALLFVAALAQSEALLVGIDEVPYLHEVDGAFGSVVQSAWEQILHSKVSSKLCLLLTGSSRRVMNRLTEGGGPLYGRAELHLRLEPFAFEQCRAFVPKLKPEDRLLAYAVTGGYPRHLLAWDDEVTLVENVRNLVRPGSLLYDDAPLIVNEEFPTGAGFERILLAIGRGRHSFGEIKTDADLRIEGPLATLEQVGLVRGEQPLAGPRRSAAHYVITDPYLRFWFGPLTRIRQGLELGGDASLVLKTGVWETHIGSVFEDEARRHAARMVLAGELPESFVGRWWRTGRQAVEIDVAGRSEDRFVLAGEAKWSSTITGEPQFNRLKASAEKAFGEDATRVHAIWSRKRVRTKTALDRSFSLDDMAK